jgi:hypothetical protein
MALELRNRLEPSLGLTLSATMLWAYPTVATLAAHLVDRLGIRVADDEATASGAAPRPVVKPARAALARVQALSDEDMERQFAERVAHTAIPHTRGRRG